MQRDGFVNVKGKTFQYADGQWKAPLQTVRVNHLKLHSLYNYTVDTFDPSLSTHDTQPLSAYALLGQLDGLVLASGKAVLQDALVEHQELSNVPDVPGFFSSLYNGAKQVIIATVSLVVALFLLYLTARFRLFCLLCSFCRRSTGHTTPPTNRLPRHEEFHMEPLRVNKPRFVEKAPLLP